MADNTETGTEPQVTFKVKTSGDKTHTITMTESAKVLDLKTKLAGEEFENVPVDRQRLIYSGRVMKNDDALSVYKIKAGNTVHMVKSAASNPAPAPAAAASAPTPQAVPQNMAAGTTASNLLAGLTGARFAGHANLPSASIFGADGGMGAPANEDQMAEMLSNPAVAQSMNEALNNPAVVDMIIQSNPTLASMPNAREIIQSDYFRNMMLNPESIRMAARMRRMMGGGTPSFPAPGATDSTPAGAPASDSTDNANPANPFGFPGGAGANPFAALLGSNPFGIPAPAATGAAPAAGYAGAQTARSTTTSAATNASGPGSNTSPPANPFAALFGGPPAGAAAANPFASVTPEMMQQAMQFWGPMTGAGGSASPTPPDNRPPEERYADQLRQLNDMGFYDFDRNVAALRRSGGSVQGAIDQLLNN